MPVSAPRSTSRAPMRPLRSHRRGGKRDVHGNAKRKREGGSPSAAPPSLTRTQLRQVMAASAELPGAEHDLASSEASGRSPSEALRLVLGTRLGMKMGHAMLLQAQLAVGALTPESLLQHRDEIQAGGDSGSIVTTADALARRLRHCEAVWARPPTLPLRISARRIAIAASAAGSLTQGNAASSSAERRGASCLSRALVSRALIDGAEDALRHLVLGAPPKAIAQVCVPATPGHSTASVSGGMAAVIALTA